MAAYRHPIIASEGWFLIGVAFAVAAIVNHFFGLIPSLPIWGIVILLLYLFRDPPRKIPPSPLGIVSPVDGKVIAIQQDHDYFLNRDAIRISLKMHRLGIYSTRSPMEGRIMQQWFNVPEAGKENAGAGMKEGRTFAQWFQSDEGDDLVVCTATDMITRRPGCLAHAGDRIGQGQRCGFLHFGAVVNLFLPTNTRVTVKVGDHVLAGTDIIATLIHKPTTSNGN